MSGGQGGGGDGHCNVGGQSCGGDSTDLTVPTLDLAALEHAGVCIDQRIVTPGEAEEALDTLIPDFPPVKIGFVPNLVNLKGTMLQTMPNLRFC